MLNLVAPCPQTTALLACHRILEPEIGGLQVKEPLLAFSWQKAQQTLTLLRLQPQTLACMICRSQPVLLAFARGSEEERCFWRRVLEAGDQQDVDLATAMALMTKYDTIGETIARARRYGDKAIAALDVFPDSTERRAMVEVVRFCIDRAR